MLWICILCCYDFLKVWNIFICFIFIFFVCCCYLFVQDEFAQINYVATFHLVNVANYTWNAFTLLWKKVQHYAIGVSKQYCVNILKSIMIMFQDLLSFVVSHGYWFFFIYKIFWNRKFGNWVKTWSITWIFHFLMTQYEDFRWIDHSRITCKLVEQLIAKLKHFMEKKP